MMATFDPMHAFTTLPAFERVRLLVRFSWELTLVGREYYVVGTDELAEPRALRALNELQHQISQHVRALLEKDDGRYPDDVLVDILLGDGTDIAGFQEKLRRAFHAAYRHVCTEAPAPDGVSSAV